MTQLSLSHAHLMHTGAFAWLPLTWASESTHCHFLASAAAATLCQYSCQSSNNAYMHLVSSSQPPTSALPLLLSVASLPLLSSVSLPLLPGTSFWLLIVLPLLSVSLHHMPCIVFCISPVPSRRPLNLSCQCLLPVPHQKLLSS
ncbi:hypothetical protein ID866_12213 [Astraeus odoratus]|nr:hypothetical protein ID866_12213 [Astraeus odoratus]